MRHVIILFGWLFAACVVTAQVADPPTFEVASVKTADPPAPGKFMFTNVRGGPGTNDPGQVTYTNMPLKFLLINAYDVQRYQVIGPDWLDSERYDVMAKVPQGATKEQARVMLQNLLAERFKMKLHHESREMKLDELVVGKNGPKLKASTDDPKAAAEPPQGPPSPPKMDKNGAPQLDRPGMITMIRPGQGGAFAAHLTARGQPMSSLVRMLSNELRHPVSDKTGLTGIYDFNLDFAPENMPGLMMPMGPPGGGPPGGAAGGAPGGVADAASEPLLTLPAAVQQQLGLRLESKKGPVDVLVIDSAEKTPTEN